MARQVAFLRAINVGGHVVAMDRLRVLFEEVGLRGVETLIASGNVMFDSPRGARGPLERRIERHLQDALGYEVATFVRSARDLARILSYEPFADSGGKAPNLYVGMLAAQPTDEATARLTALSCETDRFHVEGLEIYWGRHGGFSDSRFTGATLERAVGMPVTVRGINTIRRLSARMPAS